MHCFKTSNIIYASSTKLIITKCYANLWKFENLIRTRAQSNTSLKKTKHCISVKHNLCHNKMLSYLHGLSLSNMCTIKCLASKYQTLYILQAQYWKHDEWQRIAQLTCIASRHQTSCTFQAQSSPQNKMLCNLWKFEDLIKHAQANVTYFQSKVREYKIFCLFK